MKLFDRSGKQIDVPDDQAPALIASGQLGAPAGTRIPIKVNGVVGSVPVEDLHTYLANGASLSSQAEYDEADLQAKYGDTPHKALALGTEALNTATLGLSNAAISSLGPEARETVRKSQQANPVTTGVGTAVGIGGQIAADLLSGGTATPALAERALAGAGERALARAGAAAGERSAAGALARLGEGAAARTGERALARAGESAVAHAETTPLEGILEAARGRLPGVGEEMAGEVVPTNLGLPGPSTRMLPSSSLARPPVEGVLEPPLGRLPPVPEELAGEVALRGLPGGAPQGLPGAAPARALPEHIADAEFEALPPSIRSGRPPGPFANPPVSLADIEAKAINDVKQAINAHAPITQDLAEAAAKVAVQDAAPTIKAYGKGLIREAVEASLLGPQRLVQGGGQAVENAVRRLVGSEAETALGRIAQKTVATAARGAFEGGVYGVANEAGHQWLQDDPTLNGERLASAWFHGALLGGAFGGGLGLVSGTGREAISKVVGNEGISSYLTEKSGERMWHAAGPTKAMTAEAERYAGGAAEVGNRIREDAQQILGRAPKSREELVELAGKMKEKHSNAIDAVLQKLDTAENRAERPKLGAVLDDIDGVIDALKKRAAPTASLEGFKQRIVDAVGAGDKLTGEIDREARLSFRQLRDIRVTADEMAKFHPYPGMDSTPQIAAQEIRGKLEGRLEKIADKLANEEGGSLLKDYKAAKRGYQAGVLLEKAAARGVAADGTNHLYSLTDKIAAVPGAMIGHAVAGPMGAILSHVATEHASKVIRRNFDFVVSDVLAKLANVSRGEHVLNAAQKTNERVQTRIDKGVKAVSRAADGKAPTEEVLKTGPQTFEERRNQVLRVAAEHEAVLSHLQAVTSPLDQAAPSVAAALQTASLRALTYLVGALPKPPPPNPASLTPELDQKNWKPSDKDKAKFNRKWEAVVHPENALALVAAGQYTRDHDEALNATHPKMKGDMAEKVNRELASRTKAVSANMRASTRLFLGVPQIEPSLGRLMQSNYKPPPAPKPELKRPIKIQDNTTLNPSPRS